ncbi:MAG: hypothetical protein WD512_15200 [Candidatus Paceibacterota bacterium]
MSISRTILSVNRCNCAHVSLMQMYMNIKKKRHFNNKDNNSEKDQSWYQSAEKHDRRMGTILIVGSTLLGGIGGMKYMYNYAFNGDCSIYYRSQLEVHITEGFINGSLIGGVVGAFLALVYPYPALLFTGVSMSFLGVMGPKYLNAKFQMSHSSKK